MSLFGPRLPLRSANDHILESEPKRSSINWDAFFDSLSPVGDPSEEDWHPCRIRSQSGAVYEKGRLLGVGAYGRVYEMVSDEGDPRAFVLKRIFATEANAEFVGLELVKAFHNRLPVIKGSAFWPRHWDGKSSLKGAFCYIAMPMMDITMTKLLKMRKLSPEEVCGIAAVIATSARVMWESGVMMNDIKTENIMFNTPAPGEPWIPCTVDFGGFSSIYNPDGGYVCTYCMPENVYAYGKTRHVVPCDEASIVWQIGVLMLSARGLDVSTLFFSRHAGEWVGRMPKSRCIAKSYALANALVSEASRATDDTIFITAVTYALGPLPRRLVDLIKCLDAYDSKAHLLAFLE